MGLGLGFGFRLGLAEAVAHFAVAQRHVVDHLVRVRVRDRDRERVKVRVMVRIRMRAGVRMRVGVRPNPNPNPSPNPSPNAVDHRLEQRARPPITRGDTEAGHARERVGVALHELLPCRVREIEHRVLAAAQQALEGAEGDALLQRGVR